MNTHGTVGPSHGETTTGTDHEILAKVHDSHCHLSVDTTITKADNLINTWQAANLNTSYFHIMSTNHIDIDMVDYLSSRPFIMPYFGIHPWFSHLFTDIIPGDHETVDIKQLHYNAVLSPPPTPELLANLPMPINVDHHMMKITSLCQKTTLNCGIGEIGLDKLFKIPESGFYGNCHGKFAKVNVRLSPCKVTMDHQIKIFIKQLCLANALKLPISVHCVKAHGAVYDIIPQYQAIPKVVLHSFSGSVEQVKLWVKTYKKLPSQLAFSFSNYINGIKLDQLTSILHQVDDDQILIETDVSIDNHGRDDYIHQILAIAQAIQTIKQWDHQQLINIILANGLHRGQ